jgi:hypothetical protein
VWGANKYHERDEDEKFMQLWRWTKNCGWTSKVAGLFFIYIFCDIKNLATPPIFPPKRNFG